MIKDRLLIELVPKTAWHENLRSIIPAKEWNKVRTATYAKAGYRCEICGGIGPTHPVECHERWEYDDEGHVQKLIGLIALCPLCHLSKHIGLAEVKGRLEEVATHIMKVNGWSRKQYEKHRSEAFKVWEKRSHHKCTVDISCIRSV